MLTSREIKTIDQMYYYDGEDLGLEKKEDNNFNFKLWAPLAENAILKIYDKYDSNEFISYEMKQENGVFFISVNEYIENKFYTFSVEINGVVNEFVDPYAKAVSINGLKGAVVDMKKTNPVGFDKDDFKWQKNPCDSVICEVSIRDISIDKSSKLEHKGKFLALTQLQDCEFENLTGLSHIKEMGFTHVQIMPFYDFASVDEKLANNNEYIGNRPYNWGYDPQNYNALEGSYSTNPYDPVIRIKEAKQMIQAIHNQGIGVIMDVVYNHMYDQKGSGFNLSMPGYFFRYKDGVLHDETGCGNVFASENKMARKFIVDSVKFWMQEYKLDGFRFDLMGLIDVQTMKEVKDELRKINPNVIIIGEGWNMDSLLSEEERAIQKNSVKLREIGFFNDTMRNSLRGSEFVDGDKGYLHGDFKKKKEVQKSIVGGIYYSKELKLWGETLPSQVVNYVECHDNYTFRDKLAMEGLKESELTEYQKLGIAIVLLAQGVPFMQVGQEFLRTKQGIENSYKSSDFINKVDWNEKKKYIEEVLYIRDIIKLRKSKKIFRLETVEEIKSGMKFLESEESCIAYISEYEDEKILVIHNASLNDCAVELEKEEELTVLVNKFEVAINGIESFKAKNVAVKGISTFVAKIK
ncbi:MAG: type I pullulanase [Sarcina sp.]